MESPATEAFISNLKEATTINFRFIKFTQNTLTGSSMAMFDNIFFLVLFFRVKSQCKGYLAESCIVYLKNTIGEGSKGINPLKPTSIEKKYLPLYEFY